MVQSKIAIRDVVAEDLKLIYQWENNPENWEVSETTKPFTFEEIKALIDSSSDFSKTQQKRWMIILMETNEPIGTIDIFQGDLDSGEVGVGILIEEVKHRKKGFATEAINQMIQLSSTRLGIQTYHVTVHQNNNSSIRLFEKCGFQINESEHLNANFDKASKDTIKMKLCVKKS